MSGKRRRKPTEKDLTDRLLDPEIEDELPLQQRFGQRSTGAQQRKMQRTSLLRAAESAAAGDIDALPVGQVVQVYSLYYDVERDGAVRLCVLRKTLGKLTAGNIVVGDLVRFREVGGVDEQGRPEAVIEQLLPRQTILCRAESFKSAEPQPIVANARQVLIVASLVEPDVRWGLIDRMIVAARSGGLEPIICLNKIDLAQSSAHASAQFEEARIAVEHYRSLGIHSLHTSAPERTGLDALRDVLRDNSTVLAGHSGVGKSSLIRTIQPQLSIRIGAISGYTGKGIHTTTSARRYNLDFGGHVIDTPGIKAFGLWGITGENLEGYFPDVEAGTAPPWRVESYQRILESLM